MPHRVFARAAVTLVLVAGVAALSSCGGTTASNGTSAASAGGAANTAPSNAPAGAVKDEQDSHRAFVSKANAICKRVRDMLNSNRFKTQDQVGRIGPKIAAFERGAAAELAKLQPPSELASDWAQIVKGTEILASDAEAIGKLAKVHQLETAAGHAVAVASGRHGIHESELAKKDGIATCAVML